MSFTFNDEFKFADSANMDAFGRLRISNIETSVENYFLSDKEPLLTSELTAGTANATWTSASTIHMSIGNTVGDRVVRQSKVYAAYQPGKSQHFVATGILNNQGGVSGLRSRIGYFDDANDKTNGLIRGSGLFYELDGTDLYAVVRNTSLSSSTQIDTRVIQSLWNLDTLDGSDDENNPSGIQLDISKSQIYFIDFEWLGSGRVRYGFFLEGVLIYVHQITNLNILDEPYMNTPILPIRYEFENISGVTHTSTMKQICASVGTEAGYNRLGKIISVDKGITTRTVSTTILPLLSIRLKNNYNRVSARLISYAIMNLTANRFVRYAIYLNPTLTTPTWNSINNAAVEYDTTASAISITGATLISSGYVTDKGNVINSIENILNLASDIEGNSDVITIAAQTVASNADLLGGLRFQQRL